MTEIILNLYLLSVICCLLIDISGAVSSFKQLIVTIMRFCGVYNIGGRTIQAGDLSLKPFDCSLCMSFWCGMIFLYMQNCVTIPAIAACLFIACAARYTTGLIQSIYYIFDKLLYVINKI